MSDDRIVRNVAGLIAKPADKPGTPRRRVYGVPRRFGMGTIFVVMTAFALLFGILKSWGIPGEYVLFLAGFLAVIGIAQALLFGGKRPRAASILIGIAFPIVLSVLYELIQIFYFGTSFDVRRFVDRIIATEVLPYLAAGALCGYVGGGVVAGVFLIMDYVERGLYGQRNKASGEQPETSDP